MGEEAERPLRELLTALSERTPAPGGGSATAWTGAMGAALLQMSAAFAGSSEVGMRAAVLREQLLGDGERELHSYEPVLEALRVPAGDPGRDERLSGALSDASEAPLSIARACAEVADLAAGIATETESSLAGDAISAVLLAEAACAAASRLIEINLRGSAGDPRLGEVGALAQRAAGARARALGVSRPYSSPT